MIDHTTTPGKCTSPRVILKRMPPKRTSTYAAPAMTQSAIKKLLAVSVLAALGAQAATMANTDNTNRNTREREAHVARKCSYKEFMSCQPFNFKGSEEALSGGILMPRPISRMKKHTRLLCDFKKLLIKKYCPRTEVQKMEDEFYHLIVKGISKTYVRKIPELETLCPTMVPNTEKHMEAFIGVNTQKFLKECYQSVCFKASNFGGSH
ncbi:hypothetical protein Tco_0053264 [Tanacetum coccineum]